MERSESDKYPIVDGQPEFNDDLPTVIQEKSSQIRVLLVSDIHLAYENLQLLLNWYFETGRKPFDYIFASGDFAKINYDESLMKVEREEEVEAEGHITKILQELEKLNTPIFYIPGNHDPKTMFLPSDTRPVLSKNSTNLHNQWQELRPNLALMALGGSTPSYFTKHGETEQTNIYFAYPYSSDQLFQNDLEQLTKQVTDKQIILMTHDGPHSSATTIDKFTMWQQADIYFGSKSLFQYLNHNQGRVVVNVHGHAHDAATLDRIQNVKVINPGSLQDGEFAEMVLRENGVDGTWRVAQFNKHFL